MGLRPLRLAALTSGAGVRPSTPTPPDRIFPAPDFTRIAIVSRRADHLVARHDDGGLVDYAIGHLPAAVADLLRADTVHHARVAGTADRTLLGIHSQDAIVDLRDEAPTVCAVTLAAMRLAAHDAHATLAAYAVVALRLGTVEGGEVARDGTPVRYEGRNRVLAMHLARDGYALEPGALRLRTHLPEILRAATPGRRMEHVVQHAMFDGSGATVIRTVDTATGTTIEFDAPTVALDDALGSTP